MRATLKIDDDVLDEARALAAAEGRSVGAVISALARRSLVPTRLRRDGEFPVFEVPAGTPTVTSEDVARVRDE